MTDGMDAGTIVADVAHSRGGTTETIGGTVGGVIAIPTIVGGPTDPTTGVGTGVGIDAGTIETIAAGVEPPGALTGGADNYLPQITQITRIRFF